MTELQTIALELKSLGWKIVGVHEKNGVASSNENRDLSVSQVKDWAAKGLNLGAIPPKDCLVIDCDRPSEAKPDRTDGMENMKALNRLAGGELLPHTMTPSDGYHFYIEIPKEWRDRIPSTGKNIMPGIDAFHGGNKFVLLPGCSREHGVYKKGRGWYGKDNIVYMKTSDPDAFFGHIAEKWNTSGGWEKGGRNNNLYREVLKILENYEEQYWPKFLKAMMEEAEKSGLSRQEIENVMISARKRYAALQGEAARAMIDCGDDQTLDRILRIAGDDLAVMTDDGGKREFMVWTGSKWERSEEALRQVIMTVERDVCAHWKAHGGEYGEAMAEASRRGRRGNPNAGIESISSIRSRLSMLEKSMMEAFTNAKRTGMELDTREIGLFDTKKDLDYLVFEDCAYNVETGELRPINQCKDLYHVHSLPWNWPAERKPTPLWDRFSKGKEKVLAGIMAALVSGAERDLYFVLGETETGKTTFMNFMAKIFPGYVVPCTMEFLISKGTASNSGGTSLVKALNSRLVIGSDLMKDQMISRKAIKSFAGSEIVAAKQLYERERTYISQFTVMLSENDMPRVGMSDDPAIYNRVIVIQVGDIVDRLNRKEITAMDEEIPHIARKLCEWTRENGGYEGLKAMAKEGTEDIKAGMMKDDRPAWVQDVIEELDFAKGDPEDSAHRVYSKELWDCHAVKKALARHPRKVTRNAFTRTMGGYFRTEFGIEPVRAADNKTCWKGLTASKKLYEVEGI